MSVYAYLHLLYDAWVAVIDKRPTGVDNTPTGIEFDTLVQVCKSSREGLSFPMHKLKSDPEHNGEALQLYYAVFPDAIRYNSVSELLAGHLQADRICFHDDDQIKPKESDSSKPKELGSSKSKRRAMIVAMSGPIGTGKTYTANHLKSIAEDMGIETYIKSFGYYLKVFCSEYLNLVPFKQYWEMDPLHYSNDMEIYAKQKTRVPNCVKIWSDYGEVLLAPASNIGDGILTIDPCVDRERIKNHLQRNLQAAFVLHKRAIEQKDSIRRDEATILHKDEASLLTARRILQIVASVFRDLAGDDFWVSQLIDDKINIPLDDKKPLLIIIDDMRFVNEAFWVKKEGGHLVYVDSPGMQMQSGAVGAHVSENSLDSTFADTIVINDHNGVGQRFSDSMERIKNYFMSCM